MRVFALSVLCGLLVSPSLAAGQTPPPHAQDALPFGRWTIVNRQLDVSSIVWSRCRAADGGPGRWVSVQPFEVVQPTYTVAKVPGAPVAPAVPSLVECLGDDGRAGHPAPAPPPASLLPAGSTITYRSSVQIEHEDTAAHLSHTYGFSVGNEASAYDELAGPVVVLRNEIDIFPSSFRLVANGGSALTIHRPGQPNVQPTPHCTVRSFDEGGRRTVTAERDTACDALTANERDGLIAEARAAARHGVITSTTGPSAHR